ncbi:HEPN domain-containing protein [Candidatus Poribacteria bacterium]|nr:HEPN domain-containing protein [Candidatus Poribacteria bacterium]
MKEYEEWFKRAKDDHAFAQIAIQNQFYAHACFLFQQTVEKSLKSYLLWKGGSYPRIHGLVDLLNLCSGHEPALQSLLTDCQILDQYYTATRYPGSGAPDPSDADAQDAANRASNILQQIANLLP